MEPDASSLSADAGPAVDGLADVVTRTSPDGRYLYVSSSVRRVLGFEPAELIGHRATEFFHPEDVARFSTDAQYLRPLHTAPRTLHRHRRADGTWAWLETSVASIRDDDGTLLEVHTISRDMTDHVDTTIALAESERRFRLTFDHSPIGIALVELDGTFIDVNDALCTLLDRLRSDLLSRTWQELTHPDDVATDERQVLGVVTGEVPGYRMEKRYLRPDGSVLWGDLSVGAVRDDDGNPLYFVSQIVDITDQKERETRLVADAERDSLTGLANRRVLIDRIDAVLAFGEPAALLFCDIDRFKAINDELGHDGGDAVLCEIAARIQTVIRPGDVASRYGGDEICILCAGVTADVAVAVAERLVERVSEPFTTMAGRRTVSASVGVAMARPGDDHDALIRRSDAAM